MKKTYIAPFCKIREVKRCNIIATSNDGPSGGLDRNRGLDNGGGYSRGWDDDDWDED